MPKTEPLMAFEGFAKWRWEPEFRRAMMKSRPTADDAIERLFQLAILRSFVETVREVVSEEFQLGLIVKVTDIELCEIVGSIDFARNRRAALADIEERVADWRGGLPQNFKSMPILDRLIVATEVMMAPDRLRLGEFKREFISQFRNGGNITATVEGLKADGTRYGIFESRDRHDDAQPDKFDPPSRR